MNDFARVYIKATQLGPGPFVTLSVKFQDLAGGIAIDETKAIHVDIKGLGDEIIMDIGADRLPELYLERS